MTSVGEAGRVPGVRPSTVSLLAALSAGEQIASRRSGRSGSVTLGSAEPELEAAGEGEGEGEGEHEDGTGSRQARSLGLSAR